MTAFIDANRGVLSEAWGRAYLTGLADTSERYYATKSRPPSARSVSDSRLRPALRGLWEENYQVYGVRKLWKAARRSGIDVGRDQVLIRSLVCGEGRRSYHPSNGRGGSGSGWAGFHCD